MNRPAQFEQALKDRLRHRRRSKTTFEPGGTGSLLGLSALRSRRRTRQNDGDGCEPREDVGL
jgi:hypothetical protein